MNELLLPGKHDAMIIIHWFPFLGPVVQRADNYPVDKLLSSKKNVPQPIHFMGWIATYPLDKYPLFEHMEPVVPWPLHCKKV